MENDRLLSFAADMGCRLMSSGAEIFRVEESVSRILKAYDLRDAEVFAVPNCIIVSATAPDGHSVTRMRRVGAHGTDLELLQLCNDLCRGICASTPPVAQAQRMLDDIVANEHRFTTAETIFGYGFAPAFFAPLFGGGAADAFCAFVVGSVVGMFQMYGRRVMLANSFFHTALSSAAATALAIVMVYLGMGESVDIITISALMMLVPGVALTNAMREIMAGDTISSLSHIADALLSAVAIALGAAVALAAVRL